MSDRRTRRVADHSTGYRPDRAQNDGSRQRTQRCVAGALLSERPQRCKRDRYHRSGKQLLHVIPPHNNSTDIRSLDCGSTEEVSGVAVRAGRRASLRSFPRTRESTRLSFRSFPRTHTPARGGGLFGDERNASQARTRGIPSRERDGDPVGVAPLGATSGSQRALFAGVPGVGDSLGRGTSGLLHRRARGNRDTLA
jgi:hypothetical protein